MAKTWPLVISELFFDLWPNIWDLAWSSHGFNSWMIQSLCCNLLDLLNVVISGIKKLPGSTERRWRR